MKTLQKRFRGWLICAVALLAIGWPLQAALAHAEPEESEPAADAVITTAPPKVTIWFTQDLFRRQGMNRIEVYDAAAIRVDQDDPVIDDDNRRLLTVSLQPDLADGVYTVRWFSLSSEDGHEGEGEFNFTLAVGGTALLTDTMPVTAGGEVTTTAAITISDVVTDAAPTAVAPAEPTAAVEPTAAPTPTPDSSGLQCFGVALPLAMAFGLVWSRRRRTASFIFD